MPETVFFRVLESDDKVQALLDAVQQPSASCGTHCFAVEPKRFGAVPGSALSYWMGSRVWALFANLRPLSTTVPALLAGTATGDDFRFVRCWHEVACSALGSGFLPYAKGAGVRPFYTDLVLVVDWRREGAQLEVNYAGSRIRKPDFLKPGITWSARAHRRGWFAPLPRGSIFSHNGMAGFPPLPDCWAWLGLLNSGPFGMLLHLLMPRGTGSGGQTLKYEVGYVGSVPIPDPGFARLSSLRTMGITGWRSGRFLDTRDETTHAFTSPALQHASSATLRAGVAAWESKVAAAEATLGAVLADIDALFSALYGLIGDDRRRIEQGYGCLAAVEGEGEGPVEDFEIARDEADKAADAPDLVAEMLSWEVGVTYGRFDIRLATGEREIPPEPDPFDPLPVYSPGMLPNGVVPADYPLAVDEGGILVDDEGHPADLLTRTHDVTQLLWPDTHAAIEAEAAEILGVATLRDWFRNATNGFWDDHIKRYSKSRRRAPIYWMLSLPSRRYSVWLYYHRFTRDTFYTVLNDYVAPKVQHEERQLEVLRGEGGTNPSKAQLKAIEDQESFVAELRAFREEVARVAPLWNPDLNDGVIINFAPLWRLVPQHPAWQKEVKACWDKLVAGDYDWAHLAMHLWPERVVPMCATDRSLAIAHELEDEFWREDGDGKWHAREVPAERVAELVAERTSPAVKAALQSLLEAPDVQRRGRGRAR